MLEYPRQILVKDGIFGVVLQSKIPDQPDTFIDPAPPFSVAGTGHRDVVSHIPRQIGGGAGKCGLQIGDPPGKLNHFKVVLLLFERFSTEPEQVGDDTPETSQSNSGEGHKNRGVFDLPCKAQMVLFHGVIQTP